MCIVTGPRIDLAITLIGRMKRLFTDKGPVTFDTKETVIELNGVHIEAYPSHHLDAMRGLSSVSFVLRDEADFFPPGQQQDARDVLERYITKRNPWIVMVSTPNTPEGLFERIEKEPESSCLYHRLFLDYTYGLNRIYNEAEIQASKASPSFEREYNLKYLGLIGNVFHTKDIEAAIEKGKKSNSISNTYTQKSFNAIIRTPVKLLDQYNITFEGRSRIFVDGANPFFIRALKDRVDEDSAYEKQIYYYKKQYPSVYDLQILQQNMFVIPVPFSKEHKHILAHYKEM